MDDDEDESEADAAQMHDGTEQQAANRNRDQSPRDQGKTEEGSHSREDAGPADHVMQNAECKKEPNGNGNGRRTALKRAKVTGKVRVIFLKKMYSKTVKVYRVKLLTKV